MRTVLLDRKHKRGCGYCLDFIPWEKIGNTRTKSKCPYDECPYHELDDVKTYEEYVDGVSDVPIAALMARLCSTRRNL